MKSKIKSILVILTLIILTASCSNDSNSTSGNFTLKYEIITSSSIVASPLGSFTTIFYTNGTGQGVTDYSFVSGTTWTKEVTVTTPNRPFIASLNPLSSGGVYLSAPGTVTSNLYVNGVRVSQSVNPTTSIAGFNAAPYVLMYNIY
jgi:hypothetical protein